jgi:AAA+ ATPase superfamily predicted ATPase
VSDFIYHFKLLPFEVDRIGSWWMRDEEIDLIALGTNLRRCCFIEVKWKDLGYREALLILDDLKRKSGGFDWQTGNRSDYFAVIAKRIRNADKDRLRSEGYIAIDVNDVLNKEAERV